MDLDMAYLHFDGDGDGFLIELILWQDAERND